jgi:hypothetical protein
MKTKQKLDPRLEFIKKVEINKFNNEEIINWLYEEQQKERYRALRRGKINQL